MKTLITLENYKEKLKITNKKYWDTHPNVETLSYKRYWDHISMTKNLSEDFIREFKDYVNWRYISLDQTLSEDFIREFQDYVDWYCIFRYQKLSEDFIREFKDKDIMR